MINILKLDGWNKFGRLKYTVQDSSLKCLEILASELHTGVEHVNKSLKKSKYVIATKITGEENNYEMLVKIKYYDSKSRYEYKKNSHRQEINI